MMIPRRFLFITFLVAAVGGLGSALVAQEAVEEKPSSASEQLMEPVAEEKPAKKESLKPERSGKPLQDMMTADEFKSAGLEKLSDEELRNLNAWLQGYRRTAETKAAEKATAQVKEEVAKAPKPKLDEVQSRVNGTMGRLTGRSLIALEDGTVWKQANAQDRFSPTITDHPPAAVNHTSFGWKMRIAGMTEFYVDPVRKK
jgi:hypothetical protein